MDELNGIFPSYKMRPRNSTHKEVAFKAPKSSKNKNNCHCSSDYSDIEMAQFVKKLKKGSKLKGKLPLIFFICGKIGYYVTKFPFKDDNDDEDEPKRRTFKRKGSRKNN